METMRCFICIDIPNDIKEKLAKAASRIEGSVSIVNKEMMHITLAFLGNITEEEEKKAEQAIIGLSVKPFYISVHGIKAFEAGSRQIVFAGIEEGSKELAELSNEIRSRLDEKGIGYDKKAFVSHITLARVYGKYSITDANEDFGRFLCNEIKIKKSVLSNKGATHYDLFLARL
ncbi:MAG: RNA 2',3'-cyclic phosphodiesterase [Candidatus Micrarchaeia archaeon]